MRFKNKLWVTAFISQLFILAEVLLIGAHAVGLTDFQLTEEIKGWVLAVVNAIFGVLATMGNIQDPTTDKFQDSKQAMNYDKPKKETKINRLP